MASPLVILPILLYRSGFRLLCLGFASTVVDSYRTPAGGLSRGPLRWTRHPALPIGLRPQHPELLNTSIFHYPRTTAQARQTTTQKPRADRATPRHTPTPKPLPHKHPTPIPETPTRPETPGAPCPALASDAPSRVVAESLLTLRLGERSVIAEQRPHLSTQHVKQPVPAVSVVLVLNHRSAGQRCSRDTP